jgi:hypothetical protein
MKTPPLTAWILISKARHTENSIQSMSGQHYTKGSSSQMDHIHAFEMRSYRSSGCRMEAAAGK